MSLPSDLSDHVRAYLVSPDVDLETVSAKQIRKHLSTIYPELDVKALRTEIDAISVPIFHEIKEDSESAANGAHAPPPAAPPTSQTSSLPPLALPTRGIPGVIQPSAPAVGPDNSPKPSQVAPAVSQRGAAKPTPSKPKKRKSSAYVESDEDGVARNGTKTGIKKPKAPRKPRASQSNEDGSGPSKGFQKELNCSPALSAVIGVPTCSRPQVVKKMWDYIKSNNLQNPQDKRQIMCDDTLKKVFKQNSINMFTMNKLLGDHLSKDDEVIQQS